MRRAIVFSCLLLCASFASAVHGQAPKAKPTRSVAAKPTAKPSVTPSAQPSSSSTSAARPEFRPAVLATGPASLVNRIDVTSLLKSGEKDGAVQFAVMVNPDGSGSDFVTYHALKESRGLEEQLEKALDGAKFTPPIFEHQPVAAMLYGTVLFSAESTPHIRVLLNQDPGEIERGSDFIGPQPVIGGSSKFTGLHPPDTLPVQIAGVVSLALRVDGKGTMEIAQVTNEEPPLLGLAQATAEDFDGAKFIPAFRDGDPTDSSTVMSICYEPRPEPAEGEAVAPFGLQMPTAQPPPQ